MHDIQRIESALEFISSEERDTWLKITMATKNALGESGLDIFLAWSSQADSFNHKDAMAVWKSIDENGPITIATIIYEAKANGWRDNRTFIRPSAAEIQERERQSTERVAKRKVELERQHRAAAKRASNILVTTKPAQSSHPYLIKKNVPPFKAMQRGTSLIHPIIDFDGALWSLQFISEDGSKLLLKDSRKRGCFIHVNGPLTPSRVIICEGWSTGATLALDEPESLVLAAIDAGNLAIVARLAKAKWPDAELIIAGDDDRLVKGNPGRTKATDCAVTVDALVAFPKWPVGAPDTLTDFNDLACYLAGGAA